MCCPHKETSQLTCAANQSADFYMRATLALNELNNILVLNSVMLSVQYVSAEYLSVSKSFPKEDVLLLHTLQCVPLFLHYSGVFCCSAGVPCSGVPVFIVCQYFAMFSAYVFITNMVAKTFCPDKQID